MTSQFLEALIYIACRQSDMTYLIWGIPVQARYVPFVHLGMDLLMGNSIIPDLIGLLSGHCYYYLKVVVPHTYGRDYLPTPQCLYSLRLDCGRKRWLRDDAPQAPAPQPGNARAFGGRGHVVG